MTATKTRRIHPVKVDGFYGTFQLTAVPLHADELADWDHITQHIPAPPRGATLTGWDVFNTDGSLAGVVLARGHHVHAEWYDAQEQDFFIAGTVRTLHAAVACIAAERESVTRRRVAEQETRRAARMGHGFEVWLLDQPDFSDLVPSDLNELRREYQQTVLAA